MSKIWKNKIKVFRKFNLKQRLELKLTPFVVKNWCPNFQNLTLPGRFFVGGLLCREAGTTDCKYEKTRLRTRSKTRSRT